jgi:adenosylmethionine-8-amino-7-oxononanoate aminotransferase
VATKSPSSSVQETRKAIVENLWMHNRGWEELAEEDPIVPVSGKGARIIDNEGKSWLDVNGGYMSVHAGYGQEEIADAAAEQMRKLHYFPQGTASEPTAQLAAKLAEMTPGDLNRSFFTSGGSESNETSIKIARAFYQRAGHSGRYKVISRYDSYHGALGLTMWLGGSSQASTRADFEPAYPGMIYAPQPYPYRCEMGGQTDHECAERCANQIQKLLEFHGPDTVAAVIAEPISVPAPVAVPGDEYWPRLREICNQYGVILIADEVITGFGRTGKMFAVDHWDVVPDIMSVAKGIVSSYLPIGASIARDDIANAFAGGTDTRYFQHVLTFSGHPVAAAAALKNIEIIERENMVENARVLGTYFLEKLTGLKDKHEIIGNVTGLGLLLGIDLVKDRETKEKFEVSDGVSAALTKLFEERGLILRPSASAITLGPPLMIENGDVDEIVTGIDESLTQVVADMGL